MSRQARKDEPLCRLCMAAGKIEPATVVDHITPLAEGGTHERSNLMPLCKRCHDSIKTPADNAEMARAVPVLLRLCWPTERSAVPATVNAVEMRFSLASKHDSSVGSDAGMRQAHDIAMAAIEGIVRGCKHGRISARSMSIVMDDSAVAQRLRACYGAEVEEIPHHESQDQGGRNDSRWIEALRSSERARRVQFVQGGQADRAGSD